MKHYLLSAASLIRCYKTFPYQKLVRDDRFHSKEAEESEEQWMSCQVMAAVHGIENLTEEQKQEILKVSQFASLNYIGPTSSVYALSYQASHGHIHLRLVSQKLNSR